MSSDIPELASEGDWGIGDSTVVTAVTNADLSKAWLCLSFKVDGLSMFILVSRDATYVHAP